MPALHELIIHTRYYDGGTKATTFFATNSSDSITQLMQDLERLKFPTPRESNVCFISPGCMRASWFCSLNSPLYNRVKTLVYRTKSPSFTHFWGSFTPANLEIAWITLTEKPVENPDVLPDSDNFTAVHPSSGSRKKMKRAHTIDVMSRNTETTFDSFSAKCTEVAGQSRTTNPTFAADSCRVVPIMHDWGPGVLKDLPQQMNWSVTGCRTIQLNDIPIAQSSRRTSVDARASSRSSPRDPDICLLQEDMSNEDLPLVLCRRSEGLELLPDETKTRDLERELENERAARARLENMHNRMRRALDTTRTKLAGIDDELKRERKRCISLEVELANERRKRQEAEDILKDVKRECRTPFVVPVMLEAFSMISKITSWTMDVDRPINDGP